jgi:hypothetical protein
MSLFACRLHSVKRCSTDRDLTQTLYKSSLIMKAFFIDINFQTDTIVLKQKSC